MFPFKLIWIQTVVCWHGEADSADKCSIEDEILTFYSKLRKCVPDHYTTKMNLDFL